MSNTSVADSELMRISEAHDYLGISRARIYKAIASGLLRKHERFGVTLIERAQVARWTADTKQRSAEHLENLRQGKYRQGRKQKTPAPQTAQTLSVNNPKPPAAPVSKSKRETKGRPRADYTPRPYRNIQRVSPARQFLLDMLSEGERLSKEIREEAERRSIAQSSLYQNAQKMTEQIVISNRIYWRLKDEFLTP